MSNCTIRGAITIEENTRECILKNTKEMLSEIIEKNNLKNEDIVSILFTATKDIDAAYPAISAREMGITEAGLMCVQEMYVVGSLEMCIRVLVTVETDKKQKDMQHIYLKDAVRLRPDIASKKKIRAIAIDGPAGSGKSTIAKLIAKHMNYIYVDTGAMYRSVGFYCIKNNIDIDNDIDIINSLENIDIKLKYENNEQRIYLNEDDVTDLIRSQEVAASASKVAKIEEVRKNLVKLQKKIAENNNIVMDGRDIGTCVLPNADVKIYMDADVDERASRRCNELKEKNIPYNYDDIRVEIAKRDEADKNRKISPLKKAEDAVLVDTTGKNINQVKDIILSVIKEKI